MPSVPRWGVISSALAPVLLIGGWTVAARLQSESFSSVSDTISALAARDADRRGVMTAALLGVGVCHLFTAAALRPAATPGRIMLAIGGFGVIGVAALPLPEGDGGSTAHTLAAGVAFGALSAWPAFSAQAAARAAAAPAPDARAPAWALRPVVARTAGAGLVATLGWFVLEFAADSPRVGLAERVTAGAQVLWPLVAVLSARLATRRGASTAEHYQRGWISARSRSS